jgi:hypothetical protein
VWRSRRAEPPPARGGGRGRRGWEAPAMTDFRACGTIMGPAGLTAVFGMGTGGAPPVWSPETRPGGRSTPRPADRGWPAQARRSLDGRRHLALRGAALGDRGSSPGCAPGSRRRRCGGDGSGWSSVSAVRIGRLRRSPAVHSRPIDLVVFQEPSALDVPGNLVLEGASRLDAFSAYPVPTWLPGGAPSGTAGTPEVGPPQSSRTRGDAPQVSRAHGR